VPQLIVGVSIDIAGRLSLSVDYRSLHALVLTSAMAADGQVLSDYASHQVLAGLRFGFSR